MIWSARTRILLGLAVLITLSIVLSIALIRQILFTQLQQRVQQSLQQEVEEMQRLERGVNPATGQPFNQDSSSIFKVFLSRNIPVDHESFITLINGEIYKTSPNPLPPNINLNQQWLNAFTQFDRPAQGQHQTATATFRYIAYPLQNDGNQRGVFVVIHSLSGEQQEIDRAVWVAAYVFVAVMLVALFLAWCIIGQVLFPLRTLTETARSVRGMETIAKPLAVQGAKEIAELTMTFNEMLDRLQASFASQREFINDASHEFQTPITVIRGHLEILSQTLGDRQEKSHLGAIDLMIDELNRMSRLVDDLLLLAKAERPDFLDLDILAVDQLTEEIFAKSTALAPRQWQLISKASVRVVGDRQRLTQLMMNLVQNAIEHTIETDTIEIGSRLVADSVHFWVRDTGTGILLQDQARILQRFARGQGRRRSKGAGLGLAIVKAIAEAHGGELLLQSQPGKGSQFTAIIPVDAF
ncbi:HAMP domain-containing histidine kinase [Microcoleus sp. FACHB-1515]|uniref:sensor histidine kinase n=1 Tax=Cyanophyceae TaxID=3028117 RepID=UPI00168885FA|nr:HAMP domain-containing sensor histidine kinase [Microcoleus sp. FACHB-1515]MBD2091511.1 HAMP domain-containing histidine kinase [Microcoleus sp. FACHB-1515]